MTEHYDTPPPPESDRENVRRMADGIRRFSLAEHAARFSAADYAAMRHRLVDVGLSPADLTAFHARLRGAVKRQGYWSMFAPPPHDVYMAMVNACLRSIDEQGFRIVRKRRSLRDWIIWFYRAGRP